MIWRISRPTEYLWRSAEVEQRGLNSNLSAWELNWTIWKRCTTKSSRKGQSRNSLSWVNVTLECLQCASKNQRDVTKPYNRPQDSCPNKHSFSEDPGKIFFGCIPNQIRNQVHENSKQGSPYRLWSQIKKYRAVRLPIKALHNNSLAREREESFSNGKVSLCSFSISRQNQKRATVQSIDCILSHSSTGYPIDIGFQIVIPERFSALCFDHHSDFLSTPLDRWLSSLEFINTMEI